MQPQGLLSLVQYMSICKRLAKAGDVWDYIDPDRPGQPLQKPEEPAQPSAVNADGSATEPSAETRSRYRADMEVYYRKIKDYRRLQDKLGQVEAHITKTIEQDLIYHIKDEDSVRMQLKVLQGLYAPQPPISNTRSTKPTKLPRYCTLVDKISRTGAMTSSEHTIGQSSSTCQRYTDSVLMVTE